MLLKDYYKILELSPGASIAEIKKNFRRLALVYHPDKNFGNKVSEAKFKEIKEAYEVLSDAKQRQEYNQRKRDQSYSQSQKQAETKKTYQPPTAQDILIQAITFRKRITAINPERMNKKAMYLHIQKLLAIQNIIILKHSNDQRTIRYFIDEILKASQFLLFPEVQKICTQLTQLAGNDPETRQKITEFSRQSRIHTYLTNYKLLFAVIVAIILCLLIYFLSQRI